MTTKTVQFKGTDHADNLP